jgi:hypothetical protein
MGNENFWKGFIIGVIHGLILVTAVMILVRHGVL